MADCGSEWTEILQFGAFMGIMLAIVLGIGILVWLFEKFM